MGDAPLVFSSNGVLNFFMTTYRNIDYVRAELVATKTTNKQISNAVPHVDSEYAWHVAHVIHSSHDFFHQVARGP